MTRHSAPASAAAFTGQTLHAFGRNLQVMFDVITSPREVVRDVRAMQAMLREADQCEAVDALRAVRLRAAAGRLIS